MILSKPKEIILITFLSFFIGLAFTFPIFHEPQNWGIQDWDQHLFYHEVPRLTVIEYGQIPLWNPYYCGGTVMLANPQSRLLSPFFILTLIFGTVVGLKIEIFLHIVLGLVGMYLLARYYSLDPLIAWLPPLLFMLSTMFTLNLTVGMTWFLSVAYLPWIFLFYQNSFDHPLYIWATAGFLALMFFEGGAYPLPITFLFLFLYTLGSLSRRRSGGSPLILFGLSLFITFCLGAIKIFPSFIFLWDHPRHISDYSGYSITSLIYSLFNRDQGLEAVDKFSNERGFWNGITYGMDENGVYIGLAAGLLFIFGIFLNWKKYWTLILCLFFFLWLGFGDKAFISLWELGISP
ncbi:MAG: hypothetical protein HY787_24705 [Deltaproteobacteria bacterium]|nr:hypothetical protein [Deltaproteobacteria bacterium]